VNTNWRVEFLLMMAARWPHQRENWLRLAAEWMVVGRTEGL